LHIGLTGFAGAVAFGKAYEVVQLIEARIAFIDDANRGDPTVIAFGCPIGRSTLTTRVAGTTMEEGTVFSIRVLKDLVHLFVAVVVLIIT
jgi:hypothetical protein